MKIFILRSKRNVRNFYCEMETAKNILESFDANYLMAHDIEITCKVLTKTVIISVEPSNSSCHDCSVVIYDKIVPRLSLPFISLLCSFS